MIRLFSAIPVPREIGVRLAMMRAPLPDARWIDAEDYHITLRFFGVVENHVARALDEQLAVLDGEPFAVVLKGLEHFGGDKPRSIFASVEHSPALEALQLRNENCARQLGISEERRKFSPHVTLARLRKSSRASIAEYLSMHGYFPPVTFTANSFALYSSKGLEGGGPYRMEAEYPLGAGDDADEWE